MASPKKPATSAPVASATPTPAPLPGAAPAPAPAPTPVVSTRDEKNGILRPAPGGITRISWDVADALTEAKTVKARETDPAHDVVPANRQEVIDAAAAVGIKAATSTTQYGRWCRYNGYVGEGAPVRQAFVPVISIADAVANQLAGKNPKITVQKSSTKESGSQGATVTPYDDGKAQFAVAKSGGTPANVHPVGSDAAAEFARGWADATAEDAANSAQE